MASTRPAPLIRSHLNGGDQHLMRRRMDAREAFRCLRASVADVRWAGEQLREVAQAGALATESDWTQRRAQYVAKGMDLVQVVRRGAAEARTWAVPATVAQLEAAHAALRDAERAGDQQAVVAARAAVRTHTQALAAWAEATRG